MKMPGYTPGVPNPLSVHRHPYPTRFHGSIYTRPVFGFPYAPRGEAVLMPSDMQGLGDYDVGQGIFRPGGYGGGVFDGNLAGLGSDSAQVTDLKNNLAAITQAITDATNAGDTASVTSLQATKAQIQSALTKAQATSVAPSSTYTPTATPASVVPTSFMTSSSNNQWIAFAVGGALALAALIYLKKKKKG